METTTLSPHDQVRAVSDIVAADPSIPIAHKNVLQTILGMLLNITPFLLDLFVSKGANAVTDIAEAIPAAEQVIAGSSSSAAVAAHPLVESLGTALTAAATQPGADPSFLDKILAFILKILPTVVGLFLHNPDSASTVGNVPAGGASTVSKPGFDVGAVTVSGTTSTEK